MFITVLEFLLSGIVITYFIVIIVLANSDDIQKEEKKDLTYLVDNKDINNYLKKEPTLNEEKTENTIKTKREILVKEYFSDWEEIDDFNRKGR